MIKNIKTNTILIIGCILVAATLAMFFILSEKRTLADWLGIGFMIAVEMLFIGSLLITERTNSQFAGVMLRAGVYSTVGLYTISSIIVSVLFMIVFRGGIKYFLAIQIILFALAAIILVLIYTSSVHVSEKNMSVMHSMNKMQELLNKVTVLLSANSNKKYSILLNNLYEAIRYCDASSSVIVDDQIALKITELELLLGSSVDMEEEVKKLGDVILILMKERATEVSTLKAGGI